ncbi:hypothetical protein [Rhizobium sp. A37_96]
MTNLDMAVAWANAEILQGKVMVGLGAIFIVSTVATLWFYSDLTRGFLVPAVLIALSLCAYGGSMIPSRAAQIAQFQRDFRADPSAFITTEKSRAAALSKSLDRNKVIWIAILIGSSIGLWLLSGATWRTFAAGFMLASACALIIDTALEQRSTSYHKQLMSLAE